MITPLEQTLVGAGVGAAAATAGSILATLLIAPRFEKALRRAQRIEEALNEVLVGLEHEIWPICTRYLTLYTIIDPPIVPPLTRRRRHRS